MSDRVKFGIVVFPGSNCDHDAYYVCKKIMRQEAVFLWHKDTELQDVDVVVLPGGFSYGDYLRCGAIARFSPIMQEVIRFAEQGGPVLGICNGFQILVEAGLLPGVLLRNASLQFVCKHVHLKVENTDTIFTNACRDGEVLTIPIAHGEGNYFADATTLERLEANNQVVFRYSDASGNATDEANPNGSLRNIAGIISAKGNVLGMMPHPERASDPLLHHTDGQKVFQSIIESFMSRRLSQSMDVAGQTVLVTESGRR
ncbi:MAG: Phosphoribosylformylglycinamidine synthase subunit PurQ [Bacteroidetes bacterium]|nr:Phosphoribosylformylglycinamidine synthase subunit PurQ [Bacteroidota bacterium]